jgi:hypothetical protein
MEALATSVEAVRSKFIRLDADCERDDETEANREKRCLWAEMEMLRMDIEEKTGMQSCGSLDTLQAQLQQLPIGLRSQRDAMLTELNTMMD